MMNGDGLSVVVHFEDTAFNDSHVSVPHNLISETQERERTVNIFSHD